MTLFQTPLSNVYPVFYYLMMHDKQPRELVDKSKYFFKIFKGSEGVDLLQAESKVYSTEQ